MTRTQAAGKLERGSWALFDFANSAFNTIVITFVYSQFFSGTLVGDQARGDVLWGHSLTVAGLCVAVLSPVLGVLADRGHLRKKLLVGTSLTTIVCTALLFFPAAGTDGQATEGAIWTALGLVVLANISFELCFVFYNAFLPGLGDAHSLGRLSGKAWALGYAGGLICLVLSLGMIGIDGFGPWIDGDGNLAVRATNLLVAGWFLLFAMPMFLFVPVRGESSESAPRGVGAAVRQVGRAILELRGYPDLARLLIARLLYNDALIALIGLAALYMGGTLGMDTAERLMLGVWLNVAAGLGAWGFGWVDDRIGARAAILWSLVLLFAGCALAIAWPDAQVFWVAATLVGIGMGPNQSASRSLMARFVNPARSTEWFGLFALSGKATVWVGPFLFATIIEFGGSQRVALTPLLVMFALGFFLVIGIDEKRGLEAARSPGHG